MQAPYPNANAILALYRAAAPGLPTANNFRALYQAALAAAAPAQNPAAPAAAAQNIMPEMNIPRGSTNAINYSDIENGDIMLNFHGERNLENPRYYKANTVARFQRNENPFTRRPITLQNKKLYKAKLVGGKRRKTRKTRRHARK